MEKILSTKLKSTRLFVTKYPVGVDTHAKAIEMLKTLLYEILEDKDLKVDNISKGINVIKERLCSKRILLILDDVDKLKQIENLLGKCNWFASGSRVIITTRDEHLLTILGKVCTTYKVKELDKHEALQLFEKHAFLGNKLEKDYYELANQVINYAKGLPLALVIIGSDLCGRSKLDRKSALDKYEKIPNEDIQEILKISYDGLEGTEQDIFLDIACFFKRWHKDLVVDILDACESYPNSGISRLVNKSLITVNQHDTFSMHDLIQQMGFFIGAIILFPCHPNIVLKNLLLSRCQDFQFENLKRINLKSCEFIKKLPELCTPNLEILDLFGCVNLVEIHKSVGFLDKLKTWSLSYCKRFKILPSNLMLKSLNSFDLVRCSRLEKFPNSHPEMKCLRDLDLQGSGIRELPSSKLCLRDCPNLRDLPDTIYKLQQLQDLSIPTTRLRFTCNSFDSISGYGFLMMEHLDIGHCLNLNKLDFLIQPDYFPALKSTSLPRTNIITIPESISRFPRLGVLSIQNCKQLREILGLPKSIKWVNATDCFKLDLQSLLSQVEAIMGILPNTSCEGAGTNLLINTQLSDDFASKTESEDEGITCFIIAPGAEIPEWCNHRSVGNYISFWVGRKFPKIALCIALGQNEPHQHVAVYFYINGRGKYVYLRRTFEENSSYLWPLPLLALFPSSSASDMDRRNFNNEGDLGISIETTNIAFDTAWRRDFDPDEFKLTLPPKAIFSSQLQYDDPCWCQKTKYESLGCILVNAVERQPPLVPDTTNGSDFGLGQPDLALGSTVSGWCVCCIWVCLQWPLTL
uniref:Uncharacterized protein n=1 Tax=Quercus lobata TaxID=97700 RepID=A0A7N2LFD4_QUELO